MDSFFNIKTQKPPENWVELIQGKGGWKLYGIARLQGDKLDTFITSELRNQTVYFDTIKRVQVDSGRQLIADKNGGLIDSFDFVRTDSVDIVYFHSQNIIGETDDSNIYHGLCRVVNISDSFFALEALTQKEYKKQLPNEYKVYKKHFRKSHNQKLGYETITVIDPWVKDRYVVVYKKFQP